MTYSLDIEMFHPLASLKEVETVDLIVGTTFSDKLSNFTGWGGLTKKVLSTSFQCEPLVDCQPATVPSCPFIIHNLVALLFLIITDMLIHR